jgi:hypothetical protein
MDIYGLKDQEKLDLFTKIKEKDGTAVIMNLNTGARLTMPSDSLIKVNAVKDNNGVYSRISQQVPGGYKVLTENGVKKLWDKDISGVMITD